MPNKLEIRLFGNFDVSLDGALVELPRSRKALYLLGILAIQGGRPVDRDRLAGWLWPESDQSQAYYNLRQALVRVRKLLGSEAGRLSSPSHQTVSLAIEGVSVDVGEFDSLAASTDLHDWRCAIQLYRGPLLDTFDDHWAVEHREARRETLINLIERTVDVLMAEGDLHEATRLLRVALSQDSLRESAWRRLMQALAMGGDAAAATMVYRDLRVMLRRDLNVDPSAETQEIYRTLRAPKPAPETSQPTLAAATIPERRMRLEPVGGASPIGSAFYIDRTADRSLADALSANDGIVRIQGSRQTGKTSLLARGLQNARREGARIVLTDFRTFTGDQLSAQPNLLLALAEDLCDQLDLEPPSKAWNPIQSANRNLERYVRVHALADIVRPIIWAFDEVDFIFPHEYCSDLFGLFRSWYNRRALDPDGPWQRLTLVFAYATEARQLFANPNQSPFNVGTRIALEDLTLAQVQQLNQFHESPLRDSAELSAFYRLLSGHPYLVRLGLAEMSRRGLSLRTLEDSVLGADSPFGPHLREMRSMIEQDDRLVRVTRDLLRHSPSNTPDQFFVLRTAGVLADGEFGVPLIRCELYRRYLETYLQ